jgi:hypothetical protein
VSVSGLQNPEAQARFVSQLRPSPCLAVQRPVAVEQNRLGEQSRSSSHNSSPDSPGSVQNETLSGEQ